MFITFEGVEGCGKSTQARMLFHHLEQRGIRCILTKEPGGTYIGGQIRQILLSSKNSNLIPLAELFLYQADRAQHFQELVLPALQKGIWVISDRCFDATTVYQGMARGLDMTLIQGLNRLATSGKTPDLTFLIDCDPRLGLTRAFDRARSGPEEAGQLRFEKEGLSFHERVREGYLSLAGKDKRFCILDGSKAPDEIHQEVLGILRARKELGV